MDQIVCGIRRHCDAGFFRTPSAEMEQKNMEQYATQMEGVKEGCGEGAHDHRGADAARCGGKGGHLREQASQMH